MNLLLHLQIIQQIHDIVIDDRPMKVGELAKSISKERVGYILYEELDMKKLCAKWVPHLLTVDQKRIRKTNSLAWIVFNKIK